MSQEATGRPVDVSTGKEALGIWVKPEIVSFAPAKAAEGISYRPLDGVFNLT